MGARPSGIFLDGSGGQRFAAAHHAHRLRGSPEIRRDTRRQQPHCSLHGGDGPCRLHSSATRNIRIKRDLLMTPPPLWRRVVGRVFALLLALCLTAWALAAWYFDLLS